ncbi:hypothetical protein DXG01_006986 [Tephrocybe rancida]|nr:hypothetical protein DXG01_006986 [Tephrocybe rancida]
MPPIISLRSWPKLPTRYQALLDRAHHAPNSTNFQTLVDLLSRDDPWKAHPDLLNLYVNQFESSPPTAFLSDTPSAPVFAVLGIWLAIATEKPGQLVQALLPAWPKMWKWMSFLYREIILTSNNRFDANIKYFFATSFVGVLSFFVFMPDTFSTVATTEDTLGLSLLIYINLAAHPPSPDDLPPRLASEGFTALLQSPLSDFNEIVQAVGFNRYQAAKSLFLPIIAAINGGPVWEKFFPHLLGVHMQICSRSPQFYGSLPPSIVMRYICEAFSHFVHVNPSSIPDSTQEFHYEPHTCIEVILWLLVRYSSAASVDHSWVIYALQGDIITLVLKSAASSRFSSSITTSVTSLLNELQLYAIHRPVFRRLSRDPALGRRPSTTNRDILLQWEQLLKVMAYLNTAWNEFAEIKLCYALKCNSRVRETTGRIIERYVDQIGLRNLLFSPRTMPFFEFIAEREMMKHCTGLKARRDKLLVKAPPPYILVADFTDIISPGKVTVRTVTECAVDLRSFDIQRMPVILPLIRVRYGAQVTHVLVAVELSSKLFGWMVVNDSIHNLLWSTYCSTPYNTDTFYKRKALLTQLGEQLDRSASTWAAQ